MAEVKTFQQLYDIAKAAALMRTSKLSEKSFAAGNMLDVAAGLSSALAEEVERLAVALHLKTFIQTAEGADLDALALDHFGLERQDGVAAVGLVDFTRLSAPSNLLIPSGTVLLAGEIRFLTAADALLTGLSLSGVEARAESLGETGNVEAGTITALGSGQSLPSDLTVTNPAVFSGGLSAETDTAFRDRLLAFFPTIRRGTVLALETGAKSVAGVVEATVDESAFPPTVYIADASGGANATLAATVKTELDNWRAAGVPVNVVGATVVNQAITLSLTFRAGFNTSTVREAARNAVVAYVNGLSIGQTLYRSKIAAAALSVNGIDDATVTNPAGDVAPSASQVLRTSSSLVTI